MNKPLLKWSPAVPIRKQDNLVTSHPKMSFTPSYESNPKENMNFLMSNEYMRIWFEERGGYEKDIYTREQIIKEESKIKRRQIQRMMTYRKPSKNSFIDDNIRRKLRRNSSDEPMKQDMGKEKLKYKPSCPQKADDKVKVKSKSKHHGNNETPNSKTVKNNNNNNEDSEECNNDCEIIVCPGEKVKNNIKI